MTSLLSSNWYRIQHLRPRLRGHAQVHRHVYRGQVWYVVEDRASGRYHRFNPAAYRVIALLDGRRDLGTVWQLVAADPREDTPGQDEIATLLGQLHAADLVQADVTPEVAELFERWGKERKRKWMGRLGNPMSLKLPLLDPDRHVAALVRAAPWLWGRAGALLWLAVVLPALALVPGQWQALTGNWQERLLSADSLLVMALVFPLVKLVHELGHALACRMRGGEVHELGLMLMLFYPVPYVDASAASGFAGKWQRMLVGAAGMGAELFVAALAFYAWLALEPGFARSVAYGVCVLGSVTTLMFNANPLLRYDGYYILADWLEIPNLASRANRYWRHLAERHLLRLPQPEPVHATPGERRWFAAYAPLAYVYRLFITFGIAFFVATQYLLVGTLLALWAVASGVLWPLVKMLKALFTEPRYAAHGARVRGVLATGAALAALLLFVVPLPYHTATEGVLWVPERAIVRAGGAGFVSRVAARSGQAVQPGTPVLEAYDPQLAARRAAQEARLEEVQGQLDAAWGSSPAQAQQIEEQLRREQASLAELDDQLLRLTARAGAAGELVISQESGLPGRWLKRGEVVGWLRTGEAPLVRLVVTQAQVDTVRRSTRAIEVRMPQEPGRSWPATLTQVTPAAAQQLPSPVLGRQGGGEIALDPRDTKGTQALESLFEFELQLPRAMPHGFLGSRVHVRFEHAPEPVGLRWGRELRRLFLSISHG
ncbi:hypothetical protein [Aquincola tertiaricarbonis]|uniref:hypothetical protein n=1 Tax=Aquincola tertiaricarbonis TaxID=391953 RepID=UPI000614F3E1|nr:hypothetical protein [Aquincola tertiaricarbonis]